MSLRFTLWKAPAIFGMSPRRWQFSSVINGSGLLMKLRRMPNGLTVPLLRVDPACDNLHEDADFKASLADPKNSAPL